MNPSFSAAANRLPGLFRSLMDADPFLEKGRKWQEKKSGIYTFSEDGLVVHVGRTRNLTRIAQVRTRLPVGRERFIVSYHDVVAIDAGFSWRTRKVTRRLDLFGWASTAV